MRNCLLLGASHLHTSPISSAHPEFWPPTLTHMRLLLGRAGPWAGKPGRAPGPGCCPGALAMVCSLAGCCCAALPALLPALLPVLAPICCSCGSALASAKLFVSGCPCTCQHHIVTGYTPP